MPLYERVRQEREWKMAVDAYHPAALGRCLMEAEQQEQQQQQQHQPSVVARLFTLATRLPHRRLQNEVHIDYIMYST